MKMISVFTPSHDPKYLNQCYRSLNEQTNNNWEWIVLLNGDADWDPPKDARVVVYYSVAEGVGALKREAVSYCTGDVYLELDHDDILMPNALMEIEYVFDKFTDVGFVYSDTAQILEDGKADLVPPFGAEYGWKYYNEEGYVGALAFEDYPHNVSYIWFAPNHLRAFRSALYAEIEGYKANLEVLDDQDIMTQLYQTETKFYHIPEILYLQRVHSNNTQSVRNAEIQTGTVNMYYQTIEKNCLAWANREGLLALDLGAHHNKAEGFLGVDLRPGPGVDYVGDIFDMDIADNSVGVIRAYDFMEHIANKTAFMEWCYDKLAHGGMLLSMTPSSDGRGAFQDPTHIAFWNENSFWYYTDKHYADFIDFECRFQQSALRSFFPSDWHIENHIPYVQANLIAVKEKTHDFGGVLSI